MSATKLAPVVPVVPVTNESRIAATVAAYVAAKPAARRSMIAEINVRLASGLTEMTLALSTGDVVTATNVAAAGTLLADMVIACNATDGPAEKIAPVPVSPLSVVAQRVADLRLAADLLEQGYAVPAALEGMPEMSVESFGLTLPYAAGDITNATKLASVKITRSTVSNAIADVITAAFSDLPVGSYLTSTQIGVQGGHTRGGKASGAINASLYGGTADLAAMGVRAAVSADHKSQGAFKI